MKHAKEAFPRWFKEVREIHGRYYWYTDDSQSDFNCCIGTDAKYSAVGQRYFHICNIVICYWLRWLRILFRRSLRTWAGHYRWYCCWYDYLSFFSELANVQPPLAALAHPAFLNEDHFTKITSQYMYFKNDRFVMLSIFSVEPLLLSCAGQWVHHWINNKTLNNHVSETDQTFPKESRRPAEDLLEEAKATYHLQLFSGVVHGFATRGDLEVENIRKFLQVFWNSQLWLLCFCRY